MISDRPSDYPVIWWAMMSMQFVYAGIVFYALPPRTTAGDPLIPVILASVAVASALLAQIIWVQFRRGALEGMNTGSTPMHPMPIVVWALDETPGLMGLIVAFFGAAPTVSLLLMAVSLVALLLNPCWALES